MKKSEPKGLIIENAHKPGTRHRQSGSANSTTRISSFRVVIGVLGLESGPKKVAQSVPIWQDEDSFRNSSRGFDYKLALI